MKLTKHLSLALIVAGLLVTGASAAKPYKTKKEKQIAEQLQKGLPVHMPLRAATIVHEAPANERGQVAVAVLSQAIELRPQLTPAFVSAIARVAPETSSLLVQTATAAQPSQRAAIISAVPTVVAASSNAEGKVSATGVSQKGAYQVSNVDRTETGTKQNNVTPVDSETGQDATLVQNPNVTVVTTDQGAQTISIKSKGGFGTKAP